MKLRNVFALLFVLAACTLIGNDLATFNGAKITVNDFKSAIEKLGPQADRVKSDPAIRERFLEHLINQKLIVAKATAEKFDQSKEFQERMNVVRDEIMTSAYIEHYIKTQTTDEKAKEYFTKNAGMFSKEEIKAAHILVPDEATAKKILADTQKPGADFTALAKKHSKEPNADKSGGDLGFFGHGAMVPEFEAAAFATETGKIHAEPVKTQFGYHIIKVLERRGDSKAPDFASVKDEVLNRMKRNLSQSLIQDLRKVADVKVDEKKLKELKF